jgi:hypothetical protein
MVTADQIRALADNLRRYTPGASAEEIAAYARRYRGWTLTAGEVRAALTRR